MCVSYELSGLSARWSDLARWRSFITLLTFTRIGSLFHNAMERQLYDICDRVQENRAQRGNFNN